MPSYLNLPLVRGDEWFPDTFERVEKILTIQAEIIAELADRVRDLESRRHSDLEEIRELVNRGLHS